MGAFNFIHNICSRHLHGSKETKLCCWLHDILNHIILILIVNLKKTEMIARVNHCVHFAVRENLKI